MSTGIDAGTRWLNPAVLIATGLGIGRISGMPGTLGTLWAAPLFAGMLAMEVPAGIQLTLALLLAAACIPISTSAEKTLGRKDPGCIVCDEYASYLLVLICVPSGYQYWVGSFLLFRLLDITKPWPIRFAEEQLNGGLGIMADDLLAAVYTIMAVWMAAFVFGQM